MNSGLCWVVGLLAYIFLSSLPTGGPIFVNSPGRELILSSRCSSLLSENLLIFLLRRKATRLQLNLVGYWTRARLPSLADYNEKALNGRAIIERLGDNGEGDLMSGLWPATDGKSMDVSEWMPRTRPPCLSVWFRTISACNSYSLTP